MLRIILACFFLWQVAHPNADGADTQSTPAYDANRTKIEQYRSEAISALNRNIDKTEEYLRQRPPKRGVFSYKSEMKKYRRRQKNAHERLTKLKSQRPPELHFGYNFGVGWSWKERPFRVGRLGYLRPCELIQIPKPGTMLVSALDQFVLIKGFDTSRDVDGITLSFGTLMEVTGTHTYTSVAGSSKTVYVLEPFDVAPYSPRYGANASRSTYRGSSKTRQFHIGSCRFGQKIKVAQLVGYNTVTDAEFDGMKPCRRCRP